jgi:Ser/Thr protein kinase RdoA (MazF antagonist)
MNEQTVASLSRLAAQAARRYAEGRNARLALLCQSENATFVLEDQGRRYALRLHRTGYHQRADIESELAWLAALHEAGFDVPQAVPGIDGALVQTIPAEEEGGEPRHAVLFHWIEGDMPTDTVDPHTFEQLGMLTARLHQHSRHWQTPAGFQRIIWNHQTMVGEDGHWGRWQDAPHLDTRDHGAFEQALQRIAAGLAVYGQDRSRYGLIHADLRLTNLLLHRGTIRLIDFDDCGFSWYLHDLAAALSFLEHHPNVPRWVEHWLRGYERHAHLDQEDLSIIPTLIIQRRIQLVAWAGSHQGTEQANSLGAEWMRHSVRLCREYLET